MLSLLAALAPDLTLAPMVAGELPAAVPRTTRGVDVAPPDPSRPIRTTPLDVEDRRTAGGALEPVTAPASAPSPAAVRTPAAEPAPETAAESARLFQGALDAARARGGAYGVSFAAVRDGELLWSGSSGRMRDGLTPMAPDSPMVIGSVTKTFVAAAVLRLAEEGRLDLDDPVRRHLPELRRISRSITLAQLLDHTSGLADLFNDATRRGLEDAPGRAWNAEEVVRALRKPWYAPGRGWAYANTNYFLLGLVVERVTGQSLAEVLTDRFTGPLQLGGTRILTGVAGDPLEPAWTSIFWASGAMAAPAADLARWGDALYGGGVLSAANHDAMLRFNDHDYGFGVQRIEVGRTKGVGHTGLLNTYTTLLFHLPERDVTVALLVNRSHVDLGAMLRADPPGGRSLLDLALGRR